MDAEHPLDAYSAAVTKVVRAVGPSVASLYVVGEQGREGSGSAVVIGDRVLVTNAHVAGRTRRVRAAFSDGTQMEAGGAADRAGLRSGDLVVTVGGQSVHDAQALQRRLFGHPPGDPLAITTFRNGAMVDVVAHPELLRES